MRKRGKCKKHETRSKNARAKETRKLEEEARKEGQSEKKRQVQEARNKN